MTKKSVTTVETGAAATTTLLVVATALITGIAVTVALSLGRRILGRE